MFLFGNNMKANKRSNNTTFIFRSKIHFFTIQTQHEHRQIIARRKKSFNSFCLAMQFLYQLCLVRKLCIYGASGIFELDTSFVKTNVVTIYRFSQPSRHFTHL